MNDEQRQWCFSAMRYGGSFVKLFAETMFHADDANEQILLPVLDVMMEKYPKYSDERMRAK